MTTLPLEAASCITEWLGEGWSVRSLAGDASVRAYYRITLPDDRTYILTYYPAEVRSELRRFLAAYEAIAPHSRVPEVLKSCEFAVLQHDAGDRTIFDVLHKDREDGIRLYRSAIDMLVAFQQASPGELNPTFTAGFFYAELEMALEYYVGKLMQAGTPELPRIMKMICDDIARHPYVLCHRDYHGQNIQYLNGDIYLIDYQDLRIGPDTYDIASLLRDRGVARVLGDDTELELLEHYRGLCDADDGIRRRYFETLLQRSIKILGTFSKQPITRGKMHYLDFIPPTLESIRRCLDELPGYGRLRDIFPLGFSLERARERAQELNGES